MAGVIAGFLFAVEVLHEWSVFSASGRARIVALFVGIAAAWLVGGAASCGIVRWTLPRSGLAPAPWIGMALLGVVTWAWGSIRQRARTPPSWTGRPVVGAPAPASAPEPIDPERERRREEHRARIAILTGAGQSGTCPTCGAAAFVLVETFKHSVTFATSRGYDGGSVYELVGRCSACNGTWSETDLR